LASRAGSDAACAVADAQEDTGLAEGLHGGLMFDAPPWLFGADMDRYAKD